jgi:hypothetical protein
MFSCHPRRCICLPFFKGEGAFMHDQLLKLRPIPNHFHREDQNVCEKCMSQFASSGSPLIDAVHEYTYVTGQLASLLMEGTLEFFRALVRSIRLGLKRVGTLHASPAKKFSKDHVHENGQHVCEKCLTGFTSTGSSLVDNIGEYFHMAHEVMLVVAQFILIAGMGIGMVVAALFPTLAGRKSAYEESLNQKARERRKRRMDERQREIEEARAYDKERDDWFNSRDNKWRSDVQKSHAFSDKLDKEWKDKVDAAHTYDEDLDVEWRRRIAEDDERCEKEYDQFEKNRIKINNVDLSQRVFVRNEELVEDDLLLKEVKNTIKSVEDGIDDPEKLRKVSEELLKQREELAAKDLRRQKLYDGYHDKIWQANSYYRRADDAFRNGDNEEGEGFIRSAQSAEADADQLYCQFHSV